MAGGGRPAAQAQDRPPSGGPALKPGDDGSLLPDLAVRRDGFEVRGDTLRVVVENFGSAPSPATTMRVSRRPFILGPHGGSSPYPPVPGQEAIWIDRTAAGADGSAGAPDAAGGPGRILLDLHFGRGPDPIESAGSVRFPPGATPSLISWRNGEGGPANGLVEIDGAELRWEFPLDLHGAHIAVAVDADSAVTAPARLLYRGQSTRLAPEIFQAEGKSRGNAEIPLTVPAPGMRAPEILVPSVGAPVAGPGGAPDFRETLYVALPELGSEEVSVWVDPDNALREVREGNNIATFHPDAGVWSQSALHLHSCFSEGPGSFDWQVWNAARSGYALLWWSEHDWRVSCRDHLESIGFEDDEDLELKFVARGEGALADTDAPETAAGERAVRLATGPDGGRARVAVRSDRKRFAYALASGVEMEARVLARSLQPGDVVDITLDLSLHPDGMRRLIYRLRWEGDPAAAGAGDGAKEEDETPWTRILPRAVPTGGWVTLRFPLSMDASGLWPTAAGDDNITGLRIESRAAGATEVLVDEVRFRHRRCGEDLIRLQEMWTAAYPNVEHQVGGEVSYTRPHLARYGGDYAMLMLDLERARADSGDVARDAERIVRAVHDRGGFVSWCHPLGATLFSRIGPDQFDDAIAGGMAGVDAVEIGYRKRGSWKLADYVELWNRVQAGGLVITGLGVNDSHHNQWAPWENNFATWLRAPADDAPALLRAIRGGSAFFGDPVRFRGRLSIQVGGTTMGGILGGGGSRAVRVRMTNIGEERIVRLLVDGALRKEWTGVSGSGVLGHQLPADAGGSVRVEVWSAAGDPLAFSNPIYLDGRRRGR